MYTRQSPASITDLHIYTHLNKINMTNNIHEISSSAKANFVARLGNMQRAVICQESKNMLKRNFKTTT